MKSGKTAAAAASLLISAGAWAAESTQTAPDPARGQKIAAEVCAACHGPDGNSPLPANPKLAGQVADYVAKQLADYKNAQERKNPVMQAMAAPLSVQDMRALGVYFSTQKPRPSAARDKDLVALGQKLYRGGNAASGVPACAGCHGPTGAGIPGQYPRISGQFAAYLESQLLAFKTGARANDANGMMRGVAARMTEAEIKAVAEYASGLR